MRKIALIGLFLLALVFASCEDEGSAEIIVNASANGESKNVWIEVYNDNGVQVHQVATQRGIGYIQNLAAGTYSLKYKGHDDNYYSAITVVSVVDGDSKPVKVDLNSPPDEGASVE